MRIGFEAKKIVSNLTGIGNYSRGMVNALSKYYPENEYYLYTPKKGRQEALDRLQLSDNITFRYPPAGYPSFLKEWWRCKSVIKDLKRENIKIYHGLSNELPVGISSSGIKSVVTIHDLIFLHHPEIYDSVSLQILRFKVPYACKHAERIIAISKKTKEDIMKFYHIPEDKIDIIYQGCDQIFYNKVTQEEIEAVKQKYNLPDKYILSVGTIEHRKNHISIIKAMATLDKDTNFILVGKPTKHKEVLEQAIDELNLRDRVFILNNIPNSDLPAIYQGSKVFVYPSYFEGFGIPVLEALVSGIPVIAATGSTLEEAGGPDSLYCAPSDYEQLARLINEVLSNPEKAGNMIRKGREYAERFSMKQIAADVMEVYSKLP